jgi:hypothetical protein
VNLREAIAARQTPGSYIRTPFYAQHQDEDVLVTAVLERTAVVLVPGDVANSHLVLLEDLVPTQDLEWWHERENSRRRSGVRGRAAAHVTQARGRR